MGRYALSHPLLTMSQAIVTYIALGYIIALVGSHHEE